MNFALLPVFLALGAFIGFLAGLLGIGGGFTMVPVLIEVFSREGFATEHLVPMAIGTSAGTIVFTSLSSARAHHARGAVVWPVVAAMSPGLVAGSLLGPQIASALPAPVMAGIFGVFIWFGAYRMLQQPADRRVAAAARQGRHARHGRADRDDLGHGRHRRRVPVGAVHDPLQREDALRRSRRRRRSACRSRSRPRSASRWRACARPGCRRTRSATCTCPALVAIAVTSTLLAPLGARAAHAMPVARLRYAFVAMLVVLGAYMWWKAFHL